MGSDLHGLRASLQNDLEAFVRFFDRGGVDHEHGGCCCGLSATGERLTGLKFVWFNGRSIWVYSRLHNLGVLSGRDAPNSAGDPGATMQSYLIDVAQRARDFALSHGRDASGNFIVEMDERGTAIKPAEPNYIPSSGYGSAFVAEGLIELFRATANTSDVDLAIELLRKFVRLSKCCTMLKLV